MPVHISARLHDAEGMSICQICAAKNFMVKRGLPCMPDIALIGDRTFLFEKLFQELGASYQFVPPGILGSPFLPPFKVVIIPTGFANPQYSEVLPALQRARSGIETFIRKGGILTVFGPLVPEHKYEWLPLDLEYICEYGSRQVGPSEHECSCLVCTRTPECDGYLILRDGFETIIKDEKGRTVLAAAAFGEGMIVATSIHEFPAAGYIKWALSRAKEAKI